MSFEVFVRPFVAPAIRPPAKPPVLPFQDTPEQGVAVLRGLGGKLIDLTFSETSSWSKSRMVETERTVAVERVSQKVKDPATGKETINAENYVEIERVKELKMVDAGGVEMRQQFAEPEPQDNIEIIVPEKVIPAPAITAADKINVYPEPPVTP